MGLRVFNRFIGALLLGLVAVSASYAKSHAVSSCSAFLQQLLANRPKLELRYEELPLTDNQRMWIPVFDEEIARELKQGFNRETRLRIENLLTQSGTYEIPVRDNGAVVAAPTAGGYGKAIWIRDLARVFDGLLALNRREEARKVAKAILAAMTSDSQTERLYQNIREPHLHFGHDGEMRVLHIRLDAETLQPLDERWNHKQNDALALSFLAVLQAFREGLLKAEDLNPRERFYLAALPTYFERLMYWEMHDGGAWEEWNGVRVSSVMLVTKVFEELIKFQDQKDPEEFARMIELEKFQGPQDISAFVRKTHERSKLEEVKTYGLKRIRDYLARGESPDTEHGTSPRYEDAAMAHAFWYPLDELSEQDYLYIIKHLKNLQREAGILRYKRDLYLHSLYYFGQRDSQELLPQEFTRLGRPVRLHEVWEIFNPRQPGRAEDVFGPDLESQWSIHDSILGYAGLFLYQKFKNPEYLLMAREFSIRSYAQVSGVDPLPSLDGSIVPGRKVPESRSKIILYLRKDGQIVERVPLMVPSNNSPLYWATAEQANNEQIGDHIQCASK